MIRLLSTQQADFARQFAAIRERGAAASAAVEAQTQRIVAAVRAIITDMGRSMAPAIVEARGVERFAAILEADAARPAERTRRENALALLEMAALGNSRKAAMKVAQRRSSDPNTQERLAQNYRRLLRTKK